MRLLRRLRLLAMTSFFISPSHGFFVDEGETGSSFLKVPLSARAVAMGSAFTAVSDDVASLEYNPAGLGGLTRTDTNITHQEFLEDTSFQSVQFAYPFAIKIGKHGGRHANNGKPFILGLQYRLFSADDDTRNNLGIKQGEFDIRDQFIQLAMGYVVNSRLYFGVGGKHISQKLGNNSLTNNAFDVGTVFKLSHRISLGASVLNFGPDKAFISAKDPLPTTFRLGANYQLEKLTLTTDVAVERDKTTTEAVGAEWRPIRFVQIRGGVLFNNAIEFTGGVGVKIFDSETQEQRRARPKEYKLIDEDDISGKKQRRRRKNGPGQASNFDLGLHYAARTHNELGLAHSITLNFKY